MPVDINGTTGVTTPALASTAMPTSGGDLIVESGSNSDGRWVRHAEGTQWVVARANVDLTTDGNQTSIGVYAQPFITDAPAVVLGGFQLNHPDGLTISERDCLKNAFGFARTGGWLFSCDGTGGTASKSMTFWAMGRWK